MGRPRRILERITPKAFFDIQIPNGCVRDKKRNQNDTNRDENDNRNDRCRPMVAHNL